MKLDRHPTDAYDPGEDFLDSCRPTQLIYFLLNVGNADTQLLCLPEDGDGVRHLIVVDIGRVAGSKLPRLIDALRTDDAGDGPLLTGESRVKLLVATHPHDDHVGGVPDFLDKAGDLLFDGGEVWDPAFYHRTGAWFEMMHWLEDNSGRVGRLHPTAGTRRHVGNLAVTALAPSIRLRNNFDSYGVHINNASIALYVEFPIQRVFAAAPDAAAIGRQARVPATSSLLLGADSQTSSWAHVDVDFPTRQTDYSPELRLLGLARGTEPLKATLFKVPHHCSKNGLNLELVTRIGPPTSLISCAATETSHAFPHRVALEQLREARQAIATSGGPRRKDWELGIHTTGDTIEPDGDPLGTFAVQLDATAARPTIWRLGDTASAPIPAANLRSAYRFR